MENLFPKESPYEIINYSLPSLAINIIKQLSKKTDYLEKKLVKINKRKIKSDNLTFIYNMKNIRKVRMKSKGKLKQIFSNKKNFLFIASALILILCLKSIYNKIYNSEI